MPLRQRIISEAAAFYANSLNKCAPSALSSHSSFFSGLLGHRYEYDQTSDLNVNDEFRYAHSPCTAAAEPHHNPFCIPALRLVGHTPRPLLVLSSYSASRVGTWPSTFCCFERRLLCCGQHVDPCCWSPTHTPTLPSTVFRIRLVNARCTDVAASICYPLPRCRCPCTGACCPPTRGARFQQGAALAA